MTEISSIALVAMVMLAAFQGTISVILVAWMQGRHMIATPDEVDLTVLTAEGT